MEIAATASSVNFQQSFIMSYTLSHLRSCGPFGIAQKLRGEYRKILTPQFATVGKLLASVQFERIDVGIPVESAICRQIFTREDHRTVIHRVNAQRAVVAPAGERRLL